MQALGRASMCHYPPAQYHAFSRQQIVNTLCQFGPTFKCVAALTAMLLYEDAMSDLQGCNGNCTHAARGKGQIEARPRRLRACTARTNRDSCHTGVAVCVCVVGRSRPSPTLCAWLVWGEVSTHMSICHLPHMGRCVATCMQPLATVACGFGGRWSPWLLSNTVWSFNFLPYP